MIVGIISRPSSITSEIPPGTPELWPLNCQKLGFSLSKLKSFHPVLSNFVNMLVGIISRPSSTTCQIPLRHSWIMALKLSKNWISGICFPSRISFQKWCHYHWIYYKYNSRILCQFGTLVIHIFDQLCDVYITLFTVNYVNYLQSHL